jgi:hypothetical protein
VQYLASVIDDQSNPGSTDRQPAISAFNERLIAEGYWVLADGLADTAAATVIGNRGEQAVFSDGPFLKSTGRWSPICHGYVLLRRLATLEAVITLPTRPFRAPGPGRAIEGS